MYQRPLSIAILAIGGFAAVSSAWALGFARIPESIPFGQALDLTVPLRMEAGESLTPGCVQAEVHVGDQRLAPGALAVSLERSATARDEWRVRLRSAMVVREPVVAVNLSVGCGGSISRQFVLFADPPPTAGGVAPLAAADAPQAAPGDALRPVRAKAQAGEGAGAQSPAGPQGAAAMSAPGAKAVVRAGPGRTKTDATGERSPAKARQAAAAVRREVPKRTAVAAAPRLKLEEPEERLRAATLTVAVQDAELAAAVLAASAAQSAASASEQRLLALETDLKTMRLDAASHRTAMEQMRQRLVHTEQPGRMQTALVVLLGLLAALVLWLGWKVRVLARERQAAWWQAMPPSDAANEPVGAAEATPTLPSEPLDEPALTGALEPAVAPVAQAVSPALGTGVLPPSALVEDTLTRPVSVDELIDLEQQAEFFGVLGEEEAAIDLLMSHLRSSGGTSPLPYLQLLEMYRRRGDREAYERMRKRFGQRFNAVAAQWDANAEQGRDLQDYPAVLATLQACWSQPLDAMAELESLLFGKRSGELFDLPAYRNVLTLFSVARDLHRLDSQPVPDVDVLLPLAPAGELSLRPMSSIFDNLSPGHADAEEERVDRPTAPVDLDLSETPLLPDSRSGELVSVRASLGRSF